MENEQYTHQGTIGETKTINLISRTYLYLFIALVLTVLTAYVSAFILERTGAADAYLVLMIIGIVVLIAGTIVINISALKNSDSKVSVVFMVLDSIAMGLVLMPVALLIDKYIVLCAFGITTLIVGGLALYGHFAKVHRMGLLITVICLVVGAGLLTLLNILIYRSLDVYYFVELIYLAVFMIYVVIDTNRLAELNADESRNTNGVAVFMAMQIYTDFLYILLRIIELIARSKK